MIPKIIHYCWFGRNPKPALAEKCIKSWKKYCPDYQIIEWNEDNFDINSVRYVREAYEAKKWAFVTDYVRLWAIYNYGGIYMDTDVELVGKLDSFLPHKSFFGFESPTHISTGIMASTKGSELFLKLLQHYKSMLFKLPDGSLNTTPNPQIITPILVQEGLILNNAHQSHDGIAIYPSDYFSPLNDSTGLLTKTKNTVAIHHFNGSWIPKEDIERRNAWWKEQRREQLRYAPNRLVRRVFGDEKIDAIKRFLGK